MPTYVVSTGADQLTQNQRDRIAELITAAHSEEMSAPRYLVQVVFQSHPQGTRYIGAKPAPTPLIWIRGDVRANRPAEQRRRLLHRMAAEISSASGVQTGDIWVYVNELVAENMVEFGSVLPQPGREGEWLLTLPAEVRNHLSGLEQKPGDERT
jgi:phenylpyruvate tautomerase PptA (4-oxalocrotonate tautomerase family)